MELGEVLKKISTNAIVYESGLEDKIAAYTAEKVEIQVKLDKLFDDQAESEMNGRSFDHKKIDQLSAEIVRINGMISALERKAIRGYEIPEGDKQILIAAAADRYFNDTIQTVKDNIRIEEINKKLWELRDEYRDMSNRSSFKTSMEDIFKHNSPLNEDAADNIIRQAIDRADVYNSPEYIQLRKEFENVKTNFPYFWKKFLF